MRLFRVLQLREAYRWAAAGGQALHLHTFASSSSPAPFRKARAAGDMIAHLIDWDRERLCRTAGGFGVRNKYIHHEQTPRQHIDLCSVPLGLALRACPGDKNPPENAWASFFRSYFSRRPMRINLNSSWSSHPSAWRGLGWMWSEHCDEPCALPDRVYALVREAPIPKARYWEDKARYVSRVAFGTQENANVALDRAFRVLGAERAAVLGDIAEDGVQARYDTMTPGDYAAEAWRLFRVKVDPAAAAKLWVNRLRLEESL